MTDNMEAFLDMIAASEGTPKYGEKNGYDVIVGGTLFTDFSDHPRQRIEVKPGLWSTAAGRYQVLARYFDAYQKMLQLADFSPTSQDAIAVQQIKESRAFGDVQAGRIEAAIGKCAHIWASLPGAGYGQHENKLATLLASYEEAGGSISI